MSISISWYSIRVPAQKMSKIVELIKATLKSLDSSDIISKSLKDIQIISITESVKKNGKIYKKEKSLYPGYFFILCDDHHLQDVILFLKKVLHLSFINILGGEKNPSKISLTDYEKMISKKDNLLSNATSFAVSNKFEIGMNVEMINGSFESFVGKIKSIDHNKKIAVIDVILLGQETTVTASFDEFKII